METERKKEEAEIGNSVSVKQDLCKNLFQYDVKVTHKYRYLLDRSENEGEVEAD